MCHYLLRKTVNFILLYIRNSGLKNEWIQNAMYDEVIEKIEQMSKLIHFGLIKVSFVCSVTVPVLMTSLNYFIFEKGDESFPDVQLM